MTSASAYFDALRDAQSRGDADFARRLVSEAANDTFDDSIAPLPVDPDNTEAVILLTAIAFSFAIREREIPAWALAAPLGRPAYLAPEEFLDDEWRLEIRSTTPELFAARNIWLTERDLQVA